MGATARVGARCLVELPGNYLQALSRYSPYPVFRATWMFPSKRVGNEHCCRPASSSTLGFRQFLCVFRLFFDVDLGLLALLVRNHFRLPQG
jgi:hypothetical protein